MTDKKDEELVALVKKGDRDAFNVIVTRYQSKVINIAYGMLSSKEDAYDAAQEVFVRIYKSIDSFKGNSSFSTWLYRITANICTDTLRKRARTAPVISIFQETDDDMPQPELRDDSPTPEQQYESTETQVLVRKAIAELPDDYREVLVLSYMHEMSYEEICAILKIPIGTVKSRLSRAKNLLKKNLSEKRELF